MSRYKSKAGTILTLIIIAFISKIFGFVREIFVAAYYGAGMETDAFFVAQTLPNTIFAMMGASLTLVFIPMFIEISTDIGEGEADKFASNIINITFLISLVLTILGYVFTPYIVKVIAPGFQQQTLALAINLTKVMFPILLFSTLSSMISGLLQARNHFIIPSMVSIPMNIIIILGIIFFYGYFGVFAVAWATLLGSASQVLFQLPTLKRNFFYHWKINNNNKYMQHFGFLLIHVIIGTGIKQINTIIDRMLASGLEIGSISAITYADRLIGMGVGIFTMSIAVVIYPMFSEAAAKQDYETIKEIIRKSTIIISIILLPFTLGIILLRWEFVTIIFSRGAFDKIAIDLTSYALGFYALGTIPFSIREILVRGFFSLQDTKTPMFNSMITAVINIILNIILIKHIRVGGLGLGSALAGIISILMLFINIKRKIGSIMQRDFLLELAKIAFASIIMVMAIIGHKNPIEHSSILLNMSFTVILGIATYFIALKLLGVKEINKVLGMINKTIKNNKKV